MMYWKSVVCVGTEIASNFESAGKNTSSTHRLSTFMDVMSFIDHMKLECGSLPEERIKSVERHQKKCTKVSEWMINILAHDATHQNFVCACKFWRILQLETQNLETNRYSPKVNGSSLNCDPHKNLKDLVKYGHSRKCVFYYQSKR